MKNIKNTLLLVLLLGFCAPAFASVHNLKRAEFEFHVGPAFPMGKFGKKAFPSFSETASGTYRLDYHGAKIGLNYGLAFQYYATPHWGILVMFNGHSNKVSANDFSPYKPAGTANLDWNTSSKGKWSEFMAMAGMTFRVSLFSRMTLAFRAYLGYAHLVAPYYSSEAKNQNTTYAFQLKSASDANFGYGAGAALKFLISRGFHLDIRCDYMGAVPFYFRRVKSTVVTDMPNVQIPDREFRNTFHENFSMINLSFGFTVAF